MSPSEFEAGLGGLIQSALVGGVHPVMITGIMRTKCTAMDFDLMQQSAARAREAQQQTAPPENGESPIIKLPPGTRLPPQPQG